MTDTTMALVTGASRGIGRAVARRLAADVMTRTLAPVLGPRGSP